MFGKIAEKIIINLIHEIFLSLKTKLPCPWNFVGGKFGRTPEILLNEGSYVIVLVAFVVWAAKLLGDILDRLIQRRLRLNERILANICIVVTTVKILWPFFLVSTYFVTCTYYAWVSTLTVLLFYILHPPFTTSVSERMFVHPTDDIFVADLTLELGGSFQDLDAGFTKGVSIKESKKKKDIKVERYQRSRTEEKDSGLVVKKTRHQVRSASRKSFQDVSISDLDTGFTKGVSHKESKKKKDIKVERYQRSRAEEKDSSLVVKSPRHQVRSASGKKGGSKAVKLRSKSPGKKGFCGRCGPGKDLPFLPGFTTLREPYTTRSGYIYGPTRRFLTDSEFMEEYAPSR